jgi:hypothetical protein
MRFDIKEGEYTSKIYSLVRDLILNYTYNSNLNFCMY